MSLGYTGLHLYLKIIFSLINPAAEENTSLVEGVSPITYQHNPSISGLFHTPVRNTFR